MVENNHREQINEKENAHQQELDRVDKEHAETVGNLNKTIEKRKDLYVDEGGFLGTHTENGKEPDPSRGRVKVIME